MISNVVETPTTGVNQLSRAEKLAMSLLSQRGEASGAAIARELHDVLRKLAVADRERFQQFLAIGFAPDATILRAAAETYLSAPSAETAASLARRADAAAARQRFEAPARVVVQ